MAATYPFSPEAQAVLDDLHAAAERDAEKWQARSGTTNATNNAAGGGDLVRLGDFFLAVSPQEGRFLSLLALAKGARRIVEFGASFGISSIYLGEAARANGGQLITTEVHPEKCAALRRTIGKAGLDQVVTALEGDARDTLADVPGPIDMVFLDGWKSGYLPVFTLLRKKLAPRALVLADNCFHEAARDYLDLVQDPASGCLTEIREDLAITCVLT